MALTKLGILEMQIIEKEGFKYYQSGEGPAIVLLHGLFGAMSNFYDFIQHFDSKFTIYLPILPLYTLPKEESSIQGMLDYFKNFIEFKGLQDITIMGNSLGGHIGLLYCLEHPEKVKSLILTGSSGLFENTLGDSYPRKSDYDYVKQKTAHTFYNPEVATEELVDEVFDIVNDKEKALRILYLAKSALRHNLRSRLSVLNIPVLLIWGREDKITPPKVADEFHTLLKHSDLHFIEECGHAPMMEKPIEFNTVTETFFKRIYS